jgi:hypothetical protein
MLAFEPAPATLGVLATAAGSLFEATPFILAGSLLQGLLRRFRPGHARLATELLSLAGCGCGGRASARSLTATAAAFLVIGPLPALLRFFAAVTSAALVSRLGRRLLSKDDCGRSADENSLLAELSAMLPAALFAGVVLHLLGDFPIVRAPAYLQWLAGFAFGFATAPCALGTVALAASLHLRAPAAAAGLLCVAGIADLRVFRRGHDAGSAHDILSYLILASGLGIVAMRHGDALLHPRFTLPVALCAVGCAAAALVYRRSKYAASRVAPAIMLGGALLVAPPPTYTATETTLTDLFPGERLTFTGSFVHENDADALERFAITCCRADATPVAIRLLQRLHYSNEDWLRVAGIVRRSGNELRLSVTQARRIVPPSDPFIYL